MTFQKHPSKKLQDIYSKNPYQGAAPLTAKIIFVGRDPNWRIDIEEQSYFHFISEYLEDGVTFWEKYNVHHPFMLKIYSGDGKKYHRGFSKINLDKKFAKDVSFAELIGVPTVGMAGKNKKLFKEILLSEENRIHLQELESILHCDNKLIFIAWGLIENFKLIYKETGLFRLIASIDKSSMDIKTLNRVNNYVIHRHFSDAISNDTIDKMSLEINNYLDQEIKH